MKVIICGAGQVGWQIARHLAREGNEITVVDNNADLIRRATDSLDVTGIAGHASYPDVLERAGARDADMLIAATHSDEVNMVTCQVAHSVFAVRRKIARLRAQSYLDAIYSDLYRSDHMPIDVVISPELEVAEAALRRLAAPEAFDTQSFLEGQVGLLGIALDEQCPVLNTPLRQLTDLFSTLRAIVTGIRRNGRLFVPEPGDQLFPEDQIYVMAHRDDTHRALEIFGKTTRKQERVVILGGGNVGLAVARALEARPGRVRVRVIERNRINAERAADELERTVVLHGDGMNMEILAEANIGRADAILAVTDDDKVNLLASVRAKSAGCSMAICLINEPSLQQLMGPLAIDAHVNPRATTVSSILRHVRQGRVRGVYSVGDAEAEVLEVQVVSPSPMAGRPIRDLDFPEGAKVGAVLKGNKVVKPTGGTRLEEGDVVVIFALSSDLPEVERLFQVAFEYF